MSSGTWDGPLSNGSGIAGLPIPPRSAIETDVHAMLLNIEHAIRSKSPEVLDEWIKIRREYIALIDSVRSIRLKIASLRDEVHGA